MWGSAWRAPVGKYTWLLCPPRSPTPYVSLMLHELREEVTLISSSRTLFSCCCPDGDSQTHRAAAVSAIFPSESQQGLALIIIFFLTRIFFYLTCNVTQLTVTASLGFMVNINV